MEGGKPEYFLGTDSLGRDFYIRLVYATRNSLLISLSAMVMACTIGVILGVLSGLYGGWVDTMISFIVDEDCPFLSLSLLSCALLSSDRIR